ncbi:MAG: hypothetical protein DRI54_03975 [Bacteroidetes bacterium]|nr:MAG: hypothetical protein DRI54_03975 [Bacteroidota bacterium]
MLVGFACNSETNSNSSIVTETNIKPMTYLDSISDVIVKEPNNSNNYYRRALFLYNEREYDQALADIERAINIDDSKAEYFYLEGNIYYNDNAYENAFKSYQTAVELDNEHIEAILRLSTLELALENYQLALDMVNKALKVDPNYAEGYYLKGFIYLDGGDTVKSISSFRTAVEVDPDHYNSYIMLGKLYASEKHEYAGDYYDNALRIRPNSIEALYNKGIYLQSIEEYDEAYLLYDQIIELDSASYFAYYNRGYMMLISDSSYSGAIKEFEKSLKFYPYYTQAFYNIGLCYENQGNYEKAEEYYRKALEIDPQFDLAAHGISRLLE